MGGPSLYQALTMPSTIMEWCDPRLHYSELLEHMIQAEVVLPLLQGTTLKWRLRGTRATPEGKVRWCLTMHPPPHTLSSPSVDKWLTTLPVSQNTTHSAGISQLYHQRSFGIMLTIDLQGASKAMAYTASNTAYSHNYNLLWVITTL